MPRKTKAEYLEDLRGRLCREATVRMSETTPQQGGARERDLQKLVDEGFACWLEPGLAAKR